MVLSFAGYSFCKGHSCSYIKVAQHACYLRANHPAEFIAAVLANGGGFYRPFAYVAEARRMGLRILPPDITASRWATHGHDDWVRVGFQFVNGLSARAAEWLGGTAAREFRSLAELRERAPLATEDLRTLIKVGACDTIAGGMTRPQMLWLIDSEIKDRTPVQGRLAVSASLRPCAPALPEYTDDRRRRMEYELLGFITDQHPMALYADRLARMHTVPATELHRHVGRRVVVAGMLTTAKPVHTVHDEPMEFATFDDGHDLIETVIFPEVYRARSHVLFDQGPFLLRGLVTEEFGAVSLVVEGIERVDRMRRGSPAPAQGVLGDVPPCRRGRVRAGETPVVKTPLPKGSDGP
jgi:error-prone DNA polymerase